MSDRREPDTRGDYHHFMTMTTRWMDNDVYGHVNNVTYYSYFDTAANDYLINAGGLDYRAGEVIAYVVASRCEYKQAVAFPDSLDIGVRVNRIGNSSVEYGIGIFRSNEPGVAAFGTFTHVFVSRATERPVAIPQDIREALQRLAESGG